MNFHKYTIFYQIYDGSFLQLSFFVYDTLETRYLYTTERHILRVQSFPNNKHLRTSSLQTPFNLRNNPKQMLQPRGVVESIFVHNIRDFR